MSAALDTLLHNAAVWRGSEHSRAESQSIASGFDAFDNVLGGWPLGALTEILADTSGVGEVGLLLPALARLASEGRWLAWVAPPMVPYAPALHQSRSCSG